MKTSYRKKSLVWAIIIISILIFASITVIKHFNLIDIKKPNVEVVFNVVQIFISPCGAICGFIVNGLKTSNAKNKTKAQLISFSGAEEYIECLVNIINVCAQDQYRSPILKECHTFFKITSNRTIDLIKLIMQNQDALDIARESVSASLLACHKSFNQFVYDYYDYNHEMDDPEIRKAMANDLEEAKKGLYSLRSNIDAIRQSKLFRNVDFRENDILDYLPKKIVKHYNISLDTEMCVEMLDTDLSSRLCLTINPGSSPERIEHDVTEIMSCIIPNNNFTFKLENAIEKSNRNYNESFYRKGDYYVEKDITGDKTKLFIFFPMIYGSRKKDSLS